MSGIEEKERHLREFRQKADSYVQHLTAEIESDRDRLRRLQLELDEAAWNSERPDMPLPRPDRTDAARGTRQSSVTENQSELIRQVAKSILMDAAGNPLMQNEIRLKMEERGYAIRSKDASELIRAALKRSPEFLYTPGKGWTLVKDKA